MDPHLTLALTPTGHPILVTRADAPVLSEALAAQLRVDFDIGAGHGLLSLGLRQVGAALPPGIGWWRDVAVRYVTALCTLPEVEGGVPGPVPCPLETWGALIAAAPPMDGAEYLDVEVLTALWASMDDALHVSIAEADQPLQDFLRAHHPAWNLVGRVCVHLAENRNDALAPFAFLVTYTSKLSAQGKAQHVPLGRALQEYAAVQDRDRLLALLTPLQRAAEQCAWLKTLIATRQVYQPLRWTAADAMHLLRDVPVLEQAGVVVRMPAAWRANRPARAIVAATVGTKAPSHVGQAALLDFSVGVAIDGEPLSADEVRTLLANTEGLLLIRGQWVEVDRQRLEKTLDHFTHVEQLAAESGLGFHEAMRLLAGSAGLSDSAAPDVAEWSKVVAGPWLADTLSGLRGPQGLADVDPGPELHATLRPYQQVGVRWLRLLTRLRLGACLADDMGLGKTLQLLALLVVCKQHEGQAPSLLVAPASLLANWAQEAERFAPSLRVLIAHPSAMATPALAAMCSEDVSAYDLVVTSYGSLHRLPWTTTIAWRLAVLDEAQAIKNPGTRQARAAKELRADARIALTGTPIENRLGDLWSLFDFINPGLLGNAKAFSRFAKRLEDAPNGYAPLRALVQPYILRRLKSDKSVIRDLPDKTELDAFCGLSRGQAALYQQAVDDLTEALATADGIRRKGLILVFLMRFKQICNHPSQWLGDGAWAEADSGKFARLRELAELIAAKQEKVLVFSQFSETTQPLANFLGSVFGRPGLVLTGETPVKQRKELVRRFQEDEAIPFFVLSLKAGGSGLTLTAASHVIHFDRWWNPAVENQATDRAYRIGQSRNVLVHKFICRGTVEEKIDSLIASKRQLSEDLLDGTGEVNLTELDDEALLKLVRLDLNTAQAET